MVQSTAGAWMLLMPGHCRGGVVQDDQDVATWWRVINHLDQAAQTTMKKSAVPDNTDHAAGLILRQNMTQPKTDPEAGTHADARIDGFKRLKNTQGIATDIPGDDTILFAEG